jgi:ferredoxin
MKVRVDRERCVGHGRCYEIAPEIFGDDERGHCVVLQETVPREHEGVASRAEANCPERAIAIGEERAARSEGRHPS